MVGSMVVAGRHRGEGRVENPTSGSTGSRKIATLGVARAYETSKFIP